MARSGRIRLNLAVPRGEIEINPLESHGGLRYALCDERPRKPMKPANIQQINDELAIRWEDEHESYFKLETLRRVCPCAQCGGERDILGNTYRGGEPKYTPASFELRSIEPVGGYAIRPTWGDGHGSGLYSFEALRRSCPCEQCETARAGKSS